MPLHLSYRPEKWEDLVGNAGTVSALRSVLSNTDCPHSYLFQGPTGCGKTTLARIVAREIGCDERDLLELNAAEARGIDTARGIIERMRYKPAWGKSRVFLLDECFSGGSLVRTVGGSVEIQHIIPGDFVFNIAGKSRVEEVFKNRVPLQNVVRLCFSDGSVIFCSKDHLFLTCAGWVKAKALKKELILKFNSSILLSGDQRKEIKNGRSGMHLLRKQLPDKKQNANVLFKFLQEQGKKTSVTKGLRMVWHSFYNAARRNIYEAFLFPIMRWEMEYEQTGKTRAVGSSRKEGRSGCNRIQEEKSRVVFGVSEKKFRALEAVQSDDVPARSRESEEYKAYQWDASCMARGTWWKWTLYAAARAFGCFFGVADGSSHIFGRAKVRIPYVLQGRHRESGVEVGDRGGWTGTWDERSYLERSKKDIRSKQIRLESIAFYEQGCTDAAFVGVIGDKERDSGFVTFYDLQVAGHPSYFVGDIPVHNCHKATSDFQNALLKSMEEPPDHVYFILCTTEPEKLLKTVRGRCSVFEVRLLTNDEMGDLLDEVAAQEEGDSPRITDAVIDEIIKSAQGHPRDALVLLDQVLGLADEAEMLAAIRSSGVDEREVIELCRALMKGAKWPRVQAILQGLAADPEKIRRAVLGYCGSIMERESDRGVVGQAALVAECFREPTYDLGRPGIILSCFDALSG